VRVLAVASAQPSKFNPDWPTLQQEGVADVDASIWTALFAPARMPQPIIEKLNAELVSILAMADVRARFAGLGVETVGSTSAQLDARLKRDAAQFGLIVQRANIKPD
jgi:tripartite-type tricarboxylate transporter receptor subunit TctC